MTDRTSLWIVFAAGLLVLAIAAASHGEEGRASRHQNFHATGTIRSLEIENVTGNVRVAAGAGFSADVEVSTQAPTDAAARKALDDTQVTFENHDGELTLVTREPGSRITRHGKGWSIHIDRDDRVRIEARYVVTVPAEISLSIHSVNGNIDVSGVTGPSQLETVNGSVSAAGVKRDLRVRSVNGAVRASCAELPRDARLDAETVNGNVTLTLPSRTGFRLSAYTMTGEISSTFAMPVAARRPEADEERADRERLGKDREKLRAEIRARERAHRDDGIEIDLSDLESSLAELSRELEGVSHQIARDVAGAFNRRYEATVSGGGASVHCSSLNGAILVLAQGTTPAQARKLVLRRMNECSVPAPPAPPAPPRPPRAPRAPRFPRAPRPVMEPEETSIVRGDVSGDFQASIPFGDVEVGRVTGTVRIQTHGGEIRVVEAGKGADLSSSGGEIVIESVKGNLSSVTNGGDVSVGSVTGDARIRTLGGDISLGACGGAAVVKTGGGDVTLTRVRGALKAETSGGSVTCEVVGRETQGGVDILSGAGDVTLTLPSNYRGELEVSVAGVDPDVDYIVSQFPSISISKSSSRDSQSATGKLNGGGPRVVIRTTSGNVTIKKGPAA
jgi:DUF4097 and DUF4098 domain-containing protein YvlB